MTQEAVLDPRESWECKGVEAELRQREGNDREFQGSDQGS